MKYSRKIALFIVFTLMIMNFTTINVQALGSISSSIDSSAEQYEITEEAITNYNSNILNDDISSLLGENNATDVEVGEITVENYDSNGNLISSETNGELNEADTELDLNDELEEVTDESEEAADKSEEEADKSEEINSDENENTNEESSDESAKIDTNEEVEEDMINESLFDEGINSITEDNEIEESLAAYSITSRASEIYDVNIISTASVTVAQMEAWAKAKGATTEFIGLAKLYKEYGSKRGGVNWALAYVQAAKETGYGKFGGVLTADYHNPCGLKNSTGGADDDPNAHKKFDNWDQGIMAHLDHLALYAGASGYPKTTYVPSYKSSGLGSKETYDPRHTGNWYATNVYKSATTVISLGGKWAPSETYGVEIFRMYCEATGTSYAAAKSNLESPAANASVVNNSLRVKGWALSAVGIKDVKVYLDNNYLGTASYGKTRTDVAASYPKYYNSENSGFDTTFDVGKYGSGKKTLKVIITANDGTTQTITVSINLKLADRIGVESPTTSTTVDNGILTVKGWALPASGFSYINLYIDDVKLTKPTYGIKRTDVSSKYSGYPDGSNCGFEGQIDISSISGGTKTIKVVIGAKDGSKQIVNIKFKNILMSRATVESPTTSTTVDNGILTVKGWALPASGFSYINLYIDDVKLAKPTYGIKRTDVSSKYPGYPDGSNCGFEGKIDISSISNGTKTLKVVIGAKDGTKQIINIKFENILLISRATVESPTTSTTVDNGILTVKGWALPASGFSYINLYIDDVKLAKPTYGIKRTDVSSKYPGYPDGSNCGFEGKIDISSISNGTKTLKVVIGAKDGTKQIINIKFENILLISRATVESPTTSTTVDNGILTVKGWALPASGFSYINLYIDDVKLAKPTYGIKRTDVSSKYPGYPDGSNCGFEGNIDISGISGGTKTIKVVIGAKDGSKQIVNIKFKNILMSRVTVESPTTSTTVDNGILTVKGWALPASGFSYINLYIDDVKLAKPTYGIKRTDVSSKYPGYPDGSNCGFEGQIDISSISGGTKTIKVVIGAKDGTKQIINIKFKNSKPSLGAIDTPTVNQSVSGSTLSVKGWGLTDSGVNYINAYIDDVKLNKPTYGTTRTDVSKVYPGYSVGSKCGFEGNLDISNITAGTKTLKIVLGANDGSKLILSVKITISNTKTVYIDPGHDYGGDQGAFATHSGVTYSETELNIEIAEYLRTELINMGYNVVMARRKGEKPTSPNYQTNLWNRINAANNINADFYVSIHNNMSGSSSTAGTEVYYSSDNPNKLSASALNAKVTASKEAATKVSQGVASALGTNNRGPKDDSFMVVRYTNMPAILVECGFISNAAEAKKLATASYQKKIAKAIADGIKATIN